MPVAASSPLYPLFVVHFSVPHGTERTDGGADRERPLRAGQRGVLSGGSHGRKVGRGGLLEDTHLFGLPRLIHLVLSLYRNTTSGTNPEEQGFYAWHITKINEETSSSGEQRRGHP